MSTKRNRTGCWTCRRRGYRCDELKPSCNTCTKLQIQCEGYAIRLRWTESTKSSRKQRKSKPITIPESDHLVSLAPHLSSSVIISQPTSNFPGQGSKEIFLLQHFYYTISGLLSSTDDKSINTYNLIILPMAFSSDALYNTLLSLSATHLSSRFPGFAVSATYHKGLALNSLIYQMGNTHDQQDFDEVTLATVIMLSIHEVFDDSSDNWLKHLAGAASMLTTFVTKYNTTSIASSTRMLLDIFAYHDVLASLSRRRPCLIPGYYKTAWSAFSGHRTAFLASVEKILSLVAQLSTLVSQASTENYPSLNDSPYCVEAVHIGKQLRAGSAPQGTPRDMFNTAEAMRHAAILYLNSSLGCSRESEEVQESVGTILELLGKVPVESASVASHVWPLYMAGSFVEGKESQEYVRERLVAMKKLRGIRSIDRVKEKLERIWGGKGEGEGKEGSAVILF